MSQSVSTAPDERGRIFRSDSSETITEALIACVKAAGGSKQVGPLLWPEKAPDAAQRLLLDCLNDDRPQNLTPPQTLLVFRLARDRGCHAGMWFLAAALGYSEPTPFDPVDQAAELQRRFIESTRELAKLAERIERLQAPAPGLRSAA